MPPVLQRNRAPCQACQNAKRKCDLNKPACSRCAKKQIDCVPAKSAAWRVQSYVPPRANHGIDTAGPKRRVVPHSDVFDGQSTASSSVSNAATVADQSFIAVPAAPEATAKPNQALANIDLTNDDGLDSGIADSLFSPSFGHTGIIEDLIQGDSIISEEPSRSLGEEQTAIVRNEMRSRTAISPFHNRMSPVPRSIPRGPTPDTITPQLWNTFVTHCVVEICPSMMNQVNPFLVHLATRARDEPALFAAVLFLSQTIITKCTSRPLGRSLSAPNMKAHVDALGQALETQALGALNTSASLGSTGEGGESSLLTQLSTMVTLCTAYITRGNTAKLLYQLESALLLAQSMFKAHLKNDTFRWLLKWLGYIHTISMLSDGSYSLRGPDYFGIASGFKDRTPGDELNFDMTLTSLSNNVVYDDPLLFSDVDQFLGISRDVSTVLYKLGRLARIKKASAGGSELSWYWQDYEAEVDDLDLRIEQQIQSFESAKLMAMGVTNLDHYNYSLVQSAKVVLLCTIKGTNPASSEVVDVIDELLEACAAVPVESTVAKFMVFPLFTAGMQSTKRLHQDFVRNRLVALRNYYFVANLPEVIERLESAWQRSWPFIPNGRDQEEVSILPLF